MKRYFCELVGTFFLVFAGTGAVIANEVFSNSLGQVGIAMTFGLIVMAVIYSFGDSSGAHINPAVTIAFFLGKRHSGKDTIFYVFFQCIGGILASLLLWSVFPTHQTLGTTLPGVSEWGAFVYEFLLTFLLMLVILSVATGAKEKGLMAGVAIGGTVALEALFAGPVTGASMNPARSLAPALISGHTESLWIYLTATTLGAAAAIPSCKWLHIKNCCDSTVD
ncbi:aquaporin [bacterium]|nr:aquaporin [bacterium]